MNPRKVSLKIGLATGFLIAIVSQTSFPQKTGTNNRILADFERRIERADLVALDRPLMEFAIANPENAKALELLARLRFRQGRLAESRALYQRVLRLAPDATAAKINSARIAFALGQKDEAGRFLTAVGRNESLSTTLRLELAAAYLLIDDTQSALEVVETLSANVRNTTGLPLLAEIYFRLNRRDEFNRLIPLMKQACTKSIALAVQCANVLKTAGSYKDGIDLLSSLPTAGQNNVQVLLALGRLELLAKDFDRARVQLKRAALLEPNSAEILTAQAYLENTTGNSDAALRLITRARDISPNSPTVLADFVSLTLRIGKPSLALNAANDLVAMEPGNPEFEYMLGVASLQSGNLDRARETLERYTQGNPNDFRGCLALGMALAAQREQMDRARDRFGRCMEIDPANAEARYQLGLLHKSQGENKQAIGLLEETVDRAPNHASALRDLGALHLESGEDMKARGFLERAAAISPKDADTHFQLIRLYNRIGEGALAKQHVEIFQKLRGERGKSVQ